MTDGGEYAMSPAFEKTYSNSSYAAAKRLGGKGEFAEMPPPPTSTQKDTTHS